MKAGALLGLVVSLFAWAATPSLQRVAKIEFSYPLKKHVKIRLTAQRLVISQNQKTQQWKLNDCGRDFADIFWFQNIVPENKKFGSFSPPDSFSKRISSYDIQATINKDKKYYPLNSVLAQRLAQLELGTQILEKRLNDYCGVKAQ